MRDYRRYQESWPVTFEVLHDNEDDIYQSVAEPLLLNKPLKPERLIEQYEDASAEYDFHHHIDICEVNEVWPDQKTIQYREEVGRAVKIRIKKTEYVHVYNAVRRHGHQQPYPFFFVCAGFPQKRARSTKPLWIFVCEFPDLLNSLLRPAAGELNGDYESKADLRDLDIFQRDRGHGGSWEFCKDSKAFLIDLEAIHKAGVKYYLWPDGQWVDVTVPQIKFPFK